MISGMIKLLEFQLLYQSELQNPEGARPFVYFFYRPKFQHMLQRLKRFSLCEVKKLKFQRFSEGYVASFCFKQVISKAESFSEASFFKTLSL